VPGAVAGIGARGSPELLAGYHRYADLDAEGRYDDALPCAEEALRLGEAEVRPDHPTNAALLSALAQLYHHQGRHADAEPLFRWVLAIDEKALGPKHLGLATDLENYAAL
jgi:tetratricopeptide (TPR) repeat protein